MGNKSNPTRGVTLACLLLLCGALWSPVEAGKGSTTVSGQTGQTGQTGQIGQTGQTGPVAGATGQAAPVIMTGLAVNGTATACGATVASGDQVCLQLASNETGTAVVSLQNETGASAGATASGSVVAGTTYNVCVTAGAADGQTRTFTVTITNTTGQSSTQQCAYVVGAVSGKTGLGGQTGQSGPTIVTSLVVNGTAAACGATVASGAQVCLQLASNETGTATVSLQNENGTSAGATASGSVVAGTTYNVCVTAGAADGQTRTFTVTITNTTGQSSTQQCAYVVGAVSGKTGLGGQTGQIGQTGQTGVGGQTGQTPPTITTSLLVNGAAAACGTTVTSGSQVCLQLTSNQTGTAVVSLQNGATTSPVASGAVTAGTTYSVCVTAGAADGLTRTFIVTVTNTTGQSASQPCAYVVSAGKKTGLGGVSGKTGPTITTGLLVNGVAAACGATVASGAQVCLQFTSDQSGTAVINVQKGTAAATTLASQAVVAGTPYTVCVTAGAADGQTRTFTVMVTNSSGLMSFQPCSFLVGAVSGKTGLGGQTGQTGQTGQLGQTGQTGQLGQTGTTGQLGQTGTTGTTGQAITTGLMINGAVAACGGTVTSGSQICLQLTSSQTGTAVVSLQNETGMTNTTVSGAVTAGTTYNVCATAGLANGQMRTFTVTVTNSSGQSFSQQCSYMVQ